ncbi:MAG: hypothetical protein MPL62_13210 [Alphaproteobacteria bacterium]|nr:hypothetical protein [Alphaproteobacteria bacterium]
MEEVMEELRMEHRGKQTTDLPAMSAAAGMPSKPAEHLGLKEARAFSHQEGVVGTRDRVDSVEGTEEGGEREAFEPEEDTDTKWLFSVSATTDRLLLKEDQLSTGGDETPAALRAFQSLDG